jgi:hypothetical protein
MLDIRGALDETASIPAGRCIVGRWLDDIPDDHPDKPELVATFEQPNRRSQHWRRLTDLGRLAVALGFNTSVKSIQLHRAGDCRCNGSAT